MSENRVTRMLGPKRKEVAGYYRRLHNEEVHNLNSSPNVIRVIKSRRMRWAGHVANMGEIKMHKNFWSVNFEEKRPLGRPRCRWEADNRMALK
jgi:hypothetical protein